MPEVYDPNLDRNIALKNARKAFPLYPQLEVVQTGPRKDDWVVCTFDGEKDYGPELIPGGARFGVGGGTTDITKPEFIKNLQDAGYKMTRQGNVTILDNGANKYVVYDAKPTGEP